MKKKISRILGIGVTLALLTSLMVMAIPASADVSSATVAVDDPVISANSEYIITFSVIDEVPKATGWIEIRFPEGTVMDDGAYNDDDIEIQSTAGFGVANDGTAVIDDASVVAVEDDDIWTVTIDLDDLANDIGEDARVRITFKDDPFLENPDTPGDYTLEVRTSAEDDWVESEAYEIEEPEPDVPAGVVKLYNTADVLMENYTGDDAINLAIADADDDFTIKVGEGRYPNAITTLSGEEGLTIIASGDVEDTIIEADITIDEDETTLSGFTIIGDVTVTAGDVDAVIENCVFDEGSTLEIDGADATVEDTTFNVEDDVGIEVDADGATITGSTFNVEEDGVGISVEDGGTDTTVEDSTFNGESGVGVDNTHADAVTDVSGSTFDGLDTAIDVGAGTLTANGNTIQSSAAAAIIVTDATEVIITSNTFTGNDDDVILLVEDDAADVYLLFNTITGNDGDDDGVLVANDDTAEDLVVANNWWGDADGPGDDAFGGDGDIVSEPFLPGPVADTAAMATDEDDFDAEDAGVTVEVTDGAGTMDIVGAATYPANPGADLDDTVGFWDVSVIGTTGAVDEITVRFYTDVTNDTEVWVWGAARGEWLEASNYTPNLFAGFISVTIDDDTTPTIADLEELPFAVVEPPAAPGAVTPADLNPALGAADVKIRPSFSWTAVAGAVSYDWMIAEELGRAASFEIPDDARTTPLSAIVSTENLKYSTTYNWRVRATDAEGNKSDWVRGLFTTMAEPVVEEEPEPIPPVEIIQQPAPPAPQITLTIPPAPDPAEVIPPYLLWVVVGVGAVLVIAVIVLIVRTRRVV